MYMLRKKNFASVKLLGGEGQFVTLWHTSRRIFQYYFTYRSLKRDLLVQDTIANVALNWATEQSCCHLLVFRSKHLQQILENLIFREHNLNIQINSWGTDTIIYIIDLNYSDHYYSLITFDDVTLRHQFVYVSLTELNHWKVLWLNLFKRRISWNRSPAILHT